MTDDYEHDGKGKHFGTKLEKVIHLIRSVLFPCRGYDTWLFSCRKRIPLDERVLIFDHMKKVAEALNSNKVQFLEIKGSIVQESREIPEQQ